MVQILKTDSTPSTNTLLGQLIQQGKASHATMIFAREQSSGRGQRGNSWESEPGANLTASVVLVPEFLEPSDQFYLTQVASLAVSDLIEQLAPTLKAVIKWPNDVYVDRKKIAGILIENIITGNSFGYSIIGIGLNVNQRNFKSDAPNPVSLGQLTNQNFSVDALAIQLQSCILARYEQLEAGHTKQLKLDYLSRLFQVGVEARYLFNNQTINAVISGVDSYGRLRLTVKPSDEELVAAFKEIVYLL